MPIAGAGMFAATLADWLSENFDVVSAIGLDGGGSTTLAVRDCGIGTTFAAPAQPVNSPSDGNGVERRVSSGLYLLPE